MRWAPMQAGGLMNSMSHTPSEEENRKEGGEADFRLECRLTQSAGKNDKGGGFRNLGNWGAGVR